MIKPRGKDDSNLIKKLFVLIETCILVLNNFPSVTFGCISEAYECVSEGYGCTSETYEQKSVRGSQTNFHSKNLSFLLLFLFLYLMEGVWLSAVQ